MQTQTMRSQKDKLPLYVQGFHQFISAPQSDSALRSMLKEQGVEARRLSRFTQLALLGALPLKANISTETAIYLGSPFSSPSKFNKIFHNLQTADLPSPLDFMANLNNAATFQLSQTFSTVGSTIFLTLDTPNYWQPLELATLELISQNAPIALVGWAFEHSSPNQLEGSTWLLLSTDPKQAVAKLKTPLPTPTTAFLQDLHNVLEFV